MGLISKVFELVFGGDTALPKVAGALWENPEAKGLRTAQIRAMTQQAYAAEFARSQKHPFDAFMDGVNRLPRPLLALGTLGLFGAAMVNPLWFASRMQGLALVPEPLWWLMGAVVSFYFGARYQVKSQDFQRSISETMTRVPEVVDTIGRLERLQDDAEPQAVAASVLSGPNAALDAWRRKSGT